jgi:hypothetical protein
VEELHGIENVVIEEGSVHQPGKEVTQIGMEKNFTIEISKFLILLTSP